MNPKLLMQQHDRKWLAERVVELEADNVALQERYDMMRQLIENLRNDLDIPSNETGLRYKVGILIEDNAALQKQVERLREALARLGHAMEDE